MADKIRIENDNFDGDDYEPTDSDEYYSEEEKELLQQVRKGRKHDVDPQKEIMAFDESDDDEEDDEENDDDDDVGELMRDSDIEGAEDDDNDLPDPMDWGTKRSTYYNTDFVDPDYSTYNAEEEEMAREEEEEAKRIQQRLLKQMKEKDFLPDFLDVKKHKQKDIEQQQEDTIEIKADLAGMSENDRWLLFQEDSPEFLPLKNDFEQYLKEVETLVAPVMQYVQEHNVPMIPALQFAKLYEDIILTYCNNVAFYLLLKAKRASIRNHPVTQRLLQLKKLLQQLQDKYENIIQPQLEALLERITDGDKFEVLPIEGAAQRAKARKTKLSILEQFESETAELNGVDELDDGEDVSGDEADAMDEEDVDEEAAENARRGITYQIAKNKGLTPHRKKELRNPRVKHRSKFRKALIRRKGAVRTVRKENKRYGGEISGIKASVSKSIKFKV